MSTVWPPPKGILSVHWTLVLFKRPTDATRDVMTSRAPFGERRRQCSGRLPGSPYWETSGTTSPERRFLSRPERAFGARIRAPLRSGRPSMRHPAHFCGVLKVDAASLPVEEAQKLLGRADAPGCPWYRRRRPRKGARRGEPFRPVGEKAFARGLGARKHTGLRSIACSRRAEPLDSAHVFQHLCDRSRRPRCFPSRARSRPPVSARLHMFEEPGMLAA